MAGIRKVMRSNCDGCIHDWPSQRDHKCLTEAKTMATYKLDNLLKDLNPAEFISLLADEARKESVVLEMLHQTLKMIHLFYLDDMKEELLGPYYKDNVDMFMCNGQPCL